MKLTKKCKADFEKWIENKPFSIVHDVGDRQMNIVPLNGMFKQLHESMKFGVYVDFFDNNKLYISTNIESICIHSNRHFNIKSNTLRGILYEKKGFKSREECREKAVNMANEIYNKLNM